MLRISRDKFAVNNQNLKITKFTLSIPVKREGFALFKRVNQISLTQRTENPRNTLS
jgi:hypothetical protein